MIYSPDSVTNRGVKENGVHREPEGPETKRAEAMYLNFYELHGEPVGEPQTLIDYN
jgi:hypothetical protein